MFIANDKDRKFAERQKDSKNILFTASHLPNISKHKIGCKIMTKINFSQIKEFYFIVLQKITSDNLIITERESFL